MKTVLIKRKQSLPIVRSESAQEVYFIFKEIVFWVTITLGTAAAWKTLMWFRKKEKSTVLIKNGKQWNEKKSNSSPSSDDPNDETKKGYKAPYGSEELVILKVLAEHKEKRLYDASFAAVHIGRKLRLHEIADPKAKYQTQHTFKYKLQELERRGLLEILMKPPVWSRLITKKYPHYRITDKGIKSIA